MLTDGFAFRLLLATERDAAMQEQALALAGGWLGAGLGPGLWAVGSACEI